MAITRLLQPQNADGTPVVITQEGAVLNLSLVLAGRDLPDRGIEAEESLRLNKTYYPGRNEATVQLLGMEQAPIVLRGRFNDPSDVIFTTLREFSADAGLNPVIGGPRVKANFLRGLFYTQERVRITWGENWGWLGFIGKLKLTDLRQNVIEYEITIEPIQPLAQDISDRVLQERNLLLNTRQDQIAAAIDQAELVVQSAQDLYQAFQALDTFLVTGVAIDLPGAL